MPQPRRSVEGSLPKIRSVVHWHCSEILSHSQWKQTHPESRCFPSVRRTADSHRYFLWVFYRLFAPFGHDFYIQYRRLPRSYMKVTRLNNWMSYNDNIFFFFSSLFIENIQVPERTSSPVRRWDLCPVCAAQTVCAKSSWILSVESSVESGAEIGKRFYWLENVNMNYCENTTKFHNMTWYVC